MPANASEIPANAMLPIVKESEIQLRGSFPIALLLSGYFVTLPLERRPL